MILRDRPIRNRPGIETLSTHYAAASSHRGFVPVGNSVGHEKYVTVDSGS